MENQKKLSKEELEFNRKANPAYFKELVEYYKAFDKEHYDNVVIH